MKVCAFCGERYRDRIDFCFQDGEVLALAPPPQPRKREPVDPATLALIMEVAAAVTASVAAARVAASTTTPSPAEPVDLRPVYTDG